MTRSLMPIDAAARRALIREQADQMLAQRGAGLFPGEMTELQAIALGKLAVSYGLDPFAEELILFQGKPYLSIRGAERIANDHPQYRGFECRPGTAEERTAHRVGDEEHFWIATVYRADRDVPAVNFGRAGGPGDKNYLKTSHGPELARKRALHRALRDAFALPALGIEEAPSSADRAGGPAPSDPSPAVPSPEAEVWDIEDGEVIDFDASPPVIRGDQIRAIHAAATRIGWNDETYRQALHDCFGAASSKELSTNQASALLDVLIAEEDAAIAEQRRVRLPAGWLTQAMRRFAGEADDIPASISPMPPAAERPPEGAAMAPAPSASAAGGSPSDADMPGSMALAQHRQIAQEAKRLGYSDLQLAGFIAHRYAGRKMEELSYTQAEDLVSFLQNTQRRDPKPIGGKEAAR
jgi:hypothetical protein